MLSEAILQDYVLLGYDAAPLRNWVLTSTHTAFRPLKMKALCSLETLKAKLLRDAALYPRRMKSSARLAWGRQVCNCTSVLSFRKIFQVGNE